MEIDYSAAKDTGTKKIENITMNALDNKRLRQM